jgi:hypothetical protein
LAWRYEIALVRKIGDVSLYGSIQIKAFLFVEERRPGRS